LNGLAWNLKLVHYLFDNWST